MVNVIGQLQRQVLLVRKYDPDGSANEIHVVTSTTTMRQGHRAELDGLRESMRESRLNENQPAMDFRERLSAMAKMTDQDARKLRFHKELRLSNALIDCMNRMLNDNEGKIKTRDEVKENELDELVAAMFGKASKTFTAVLQTCFLGYGEDALVLLRSNINLMINLSYILKNEAVQRASAFIGYSHLEQKKYIELQGGQKPGWFEKVRWDKCKKAAEAWPKIIEKRAEEAGESFHYNTGYRFYSSIEHSDAWSLSSYMEGKGSGTLHINSAPSDKYVSVALEHNFAVMANVLYKFCEHFSIGFSAYQSELDSAYRLFQAEPEPRTDARKD